VRTGTRLDPILAAVRSRLEERRGLATTNDLRRELDPDPGARERFVEALRTPGLAFIAECKRRSPSAGRLTAEGDLAARASAYARGGASALSVLTEEDHFQGSAADLQRVAASGLPRLRKDFLLDEWMVLESVQMGAEAVLLLAVCVPDPQLAELCAVAHEVGLAVLLEVHNEDELERALAADPDCIGVNARDLKTFHVDLATVERLLPLVPEGVVRVAESGLQTTADIARVRAAGADAALIGEALMRAPDPAARLREWKAALGG